MLVSTVIHDGRSSMVKLSVRLPLFFTLTENVAVPSLPLFTHTLSFSHFKVLRSTLAIQLIGRDTLPFLSLTPLTSKWSVVPLYSRRALLTVM